MINSYKRFWTKAFDFNGRSTRSEYWFAVLANSLINLLILIIFSVLTLINENLGLVIYFIYFFYNLGQFIPSISICIRRVRDMGKGWQWIFINLIPILGNIWFFVLLCQPSLPTT